MIPALRLIQYREESGRPRVGWITEDGQSVGSVGSFESTYELAQAASSAAESLDGFASKQAAKPAISYAALLQDRRVLPPLGNQFVLIIKDTALVSTLAVTEMTYQAKLLTDRTAAAYEVFLTLALFYLVLIAFSEHVGFTPAYVGAAVAATLLVGGYARAALGSTKRALLLGLLQAGAYGMFYLLVQSDDYALVLGASTLFLVLGIAMYLTRRVDWYALASR